MHTLTRGGILVCYTKEMGGFKREGTRIIINGENEITDSYNRYTDNQRALPLLIRSMSQKAKRNFETIKF